MLMSPATPRSHRRCRSQMPRARWPLPHHARLPRVPHHDAPVKIPLPRVEIPLLRQLPDLLLQLGDVAARFALLLLAALPEPMAGRGVAFALLVRDLGGRLHVHGHLDGAGFGLERHYLVGGGGVVVRVVGGGAGNWAVGVRVRAKGVVVRERRRRRVGAPRGGVWDTEEG